MHKHITKSSAASSADIFPTNSTPLPSASDDLTAAATPGPPAPSCLIVTDPVNSSHHRSLLGQSPSVSPSFLPRFMRGGSSAPALSLFLDTLSSPPSPDHQSSGGISPSFLSLCTNGPISPSIDPYQLGSSSFSPTTQCHSPPFDINLLDPLAAVSTTLPPDTQPSRYLRSPSPPRVFFAPASSLASLSSDAHLDPHLPLLAPGPPTAHGLELSASPSSPASFASSVSPVDRPLLDSTSPSPHSPPTPLALSYLSEPDAPLSQLRGFPPLSERIAFYTTM